MVETKTNTKKASSKKATTTGKRGRPPGNSASGTGTIPKPESVEAQREEGQGDENGRVKNTVVEKSPTEKSKSKAKQTATTTKPTAVVTDPYTKAIKEFDKIKPTSDLYLQIGYQTLIVIVSPNVKREFYQVLAEGAAKIGLQYNVSNRTVYLNGITPNYDINVVLKAIETAASMYNLKTQMSGQAPSANVEEIQQRLTSLVHSLLPAE